MDTLLIAQTDNEIMKELLECLKEVRYAAYETSHAYTGADGDADSICSSHTVEMLNRTDDAIERATKWIAGED